MDFYIRNNPVCGSTDLVMRRAADRCPDDKHRIRYFRTILSDVKEERNRQQNQQSANFLKTILGMGVSGDSYVGVGAQRHAAISGSIWGMRSTLGALTLLKDQFHRQTKYKYATLSERLFNSFTFVYWILGIVLLPLFAAVLALLAARGH
jgi:hypothetical protein